jgi:hypothetical protein
MTGGTDGSGSSGDEPVELRDLPMLRPSALLNALIESGVDFVVIGGFSLAAHGIVRGTKDLDVVPSPSSENLTCLVQALDRLDARPLLADDFDPSELGIELDTEGLGLGGNWVLKTEYGRLDVMQSVSGIASYAQLRENAVAAAVPGVEGEVLFAGLDDLITMKQAAGRDQDRIDIADLERARGVGRDES